MAIKLTDLIAQVARDVETKVQRARDDVRSTLRDALRQECRLVMRTQEETAQRRQGAQVPVEVQAGQPLAREDIEFPGDITRYERCSAATVQHWHGKNGLKSATISGTETLAKAIQAIEKSVKYRKISAYRFAVAPMMDWTDRHCRYFHRLLTRRALLYTEMLTTGAVLHGDRARLLRFDPSEHPVAVQLGGCDPGALAASARICADAGFDEINLNVGCPSDRVRNGRFGACLMAEPALVGECVAAMKAAVAVPVTVKCRIGIDDQDPEAALDALADAAAAADVDRLIVHARKAWLSGLSPAENRSVPALDYARVYRLKQRLAALPVVLNGGVATVEQARIHLARLDGVMMGRAAYREPWRLLDVDPMLFDAPAPATTVRMVAEAMIAYVERETAAGVRASSVLRHLVGLFHRVPGARAFRRHLSIASVKPGAGAEVLRDALGLIRSGDALAEAGRPPPFPLPLAGEGTAGAAAA